MDVGAKVKANQRHNLCTEFSLLEISDWSEITIRKYNHFSNVGVELHVDWIFRYLKEV